MRRFVVIILLAFPVLSRVLAAELLSARIYTLPEKPYVGEVASLFVEISTTDGCEVRNVNVAGFPVTNYASLGQLVSLPVQEIRDEEGRRWTLHRFRTSLRADGPMDRSPRPVVQLEAGRVSSGWFGSHWMWFPERVVADCQRLVVRPLPDEGRPEGFSGAVGDFSLELSADSTEVWKDDIVNLSLVLRGKGYAGEVPPAIPPLPKDLFRVYEPKIAHRDDASVFSVNQVVIPLTTQSVEIASASFSFFNPSEERYVTASSRPVRFRFRKREAGAIPAVREVQVDSVSENPRPVQTLEVTGTTLRAATHLLLPVFAGLLAGLFALAVSRALGMKYRYAAPIGLAVAFLLAIVLRRHPLVRPEVPWTTAGASALRLAPSSNARITLELPSGIEVELLEKSGEWVRIRFQGQAGWLRASSVRQARSPAD